MLSLHLHSKNNELLDELILDESHLNNNHITFKDTF